MRELPLLLAALLILTGAGRTCLSWRRRHAQKTRQQQGAHTEAYLTQLDMDRFWWTFAAGRSFATPEEETAARAASDWQYGTEHHMTGHEPPVLLRTQARHVESQAADRAKTGGQTLPVHGAP